MRGMATGSTRDTWMAGAVLLLHVCDTDVRNEVRLATSRDPKQNIPQTVFCCRGSYGVGKGVLICVPAR